MEMRTARAHPDFSDYGGLRSFCGLQHHYARPNPSRVCLAWLQRGRSFTGGPKSQHFLSDLLWMIHVWLLQTSLPALLELTMRYWLLGWIGWSCNVPPLPQFWWGALLLDRIQFSKQESKSAFMLMQTFSRGALKAVSQSSSYSKSGIMGNQWYILNKQVTWILVGLLPTMTRFGSY